MSAPEDRKVSSLAELPTTIEPGRDLWPAIEARLKSQSPSLPPQAAVSARFTRLRWLAAAAMVASVAVGVWIGRDLWPLPGAGTGSGPLTAQHALTGGAAVNAAYMSDPRYRRERAQLMQSVQAQLETMPAPTRAKVAASLAVIESAKKDLENALGKDPSNALLQELLINTYQDEMRVLTDVHEAGDAGRGI
jgi:hypothetical protein